MSKYNYRTHDSIESTMHEYKRGRMKSGRGRWPVHSEKQALTLGFSKVRQHHYRVPQQSTK